MYQPQLMRSSNQRSWKEKKAISYLTWLEPQLFFHLSHWENIQVTVFFFQAHFIFLSQHSSTAMLHTNLFYNLALAPPLHLLHKYSYNISKVPKNFIPSFLIHLKFWYSNLSLFCRPRTQLSIKSVSVLVLQLQFAKLFFPLIVFFSFRSIVQLPSEAYIYSLLKQSSCSSALPPS